MLRAQGMNLPNMKISLLEDREEQRRPKLDRAMNSEEMSKPQSIAFYRMATATRKPSSRFATDSWSRLCYGNMTVPEA